ncbi:MAG: hypothetical protein ACHQKY_00675 [Terriglobia bacterium]
MADAKESITKKAPDKMQRWEVKGFQVMDVPRGTTRSGKGQSPKRENPNSKGQNPNKTQIPIPKQKE